MFETGIAIFSTTSPTGEIRKIDPPPYRQFQTKPSSSIADPSGSPGPIFSTNTRRFPIFEFLPSGTKSYAQITLRVEHPQ
jgi:hypothetical protein